MKEKLCDMEVFKNILSSFDVDLIDDLIDDLILDGILAGNSVGGINAMFWKTHDLAP
jgi:hypothetical protein